MIKQVITASYARGNSYIVQLTNGTEYEVQKEGSLWCYPELNLSDRSLVTLIETIVKAEEEFEQWRTALQSRIKAL